MAKEVSAEKLVKDIRRQTRRKSTAEEKIRIDPAITDYKRKPAKPRNGRRETSH